jgi:hypothetical protein
VNSNNFFSAVPGFVNGVHSLQNELITAAFVIAFAGLVVHACHAMVGRNVAGMYLSLVRLALIPIIILGLQSWGDLLVTAVNGLTSDLGANGNGANIFQAYQAAIALKLGSANINQTNAPAIPVTTEGDISWVRATTAERRDVDALRLSGRYDAGRKFRSGERRLSFFVCSRFTHSDVFGGFDSERGSAVQPFARAKLQGYHDGRSDL